MNESIRFFSLHPLHREHFYIISLSSPQVMTILGAFKNTFSLHCSLFYPTTVITHFHSCIHLINYYAARLAHGVYLMFHNSAFPLLCRKSTLNGSSGFTSDHLIRYMGEQANARSLFLEPKKRCKSFFFFCVLNTGCAIKFRCEPLALERSFMTIGCDENETVARAGEFHTCPTFYYIPRMCNFIETRKKL